MDPITRVCVRPKEPPAGPGGAALQRRTAGQVSAWGGSCVCACVCVGVCVRVRPAQAAALLRPETRVQVLSVFGSCGFWSRLV